MFKSSQPTLYISIYADNSVYQRYNDPLSSSGGAYSNIYFSNNDPLLSSEWMYNSLSYASNFDYSGYMRDVANIYKSVSYILDSGFFSASSSALPWQQITGLAN